MGTHHLKTQKTLDASFYERDDVVQIAQDLLGKMLFSTIGGNLTGGIIIETEAYRGAEDRACHAYNNRRTKRTEVMFQRGGLSYVYLCYGIHSLLNVVTNTHGIPHAVLIRGLQPTHGLELMEERRGKKEKLCAGPGALTQALGITLKHNALALDRPPLWIEESGILIPKSGIVSSPRIGVAYAKEHALLPWRFFLASSSSMRYK
jgi:DNA-3-methyladenine glycosylase